MAQVFLTVLNMSIAASYAVLAVLVLRFALKKAPKWITVLLWGIVALRLAFPFSLESVFSLIPNAETVSPDIMMDRTPAINTGIPIVNEVINPVISGSFTPDPLTSANPLQIWIPVCAVFWALGIVAMLVYTAVSYARIRRRVQTAVRLRGNVWQSENADSPFVLGLFRPRIYLPFAIGDGEMAHVIAHETAHIARRDHLWKPLGFLLLTVHWFNPVMWIGYALLCRDIELACDEKVIASLDREARADYSEALLSCSVNRRMIAACPLAFGEVGVKKRVRSVLCYRKPAFWLLAAAIVAVAAAAVCFLTDPVSVNGSVGDRLEEYVDRQVLGHFQNEHSQDNACVADWELLGMRRRGAEITLYTWVLYEEYGWDGSAPYLESSAHIPTVITVKRADGGYQLLEYWEAGDGTYHVPSIKAKFPWYLHRKALDPQRYFPKQNAACLDAAWDYFSSVGGAGHNRLLVYEETVSCADEIGVGDAVFFGALNRDKLYISSVAHLPIFKFDTLQEWEGFKRSMGKAFDFTSGRDGVPSFDEATAKYDAAFFEEGTLLLIFTTGFLDAPVGVHSIVYDESFFYVHVGMPDAGERSAEEERVNWFLTVAVADGLSEHCTAFDADLNIVEEASVPAPTVPMPKPPVLYAEAGGEAVKAMQGTSEWTYENEDGVGMTTHFDSSHPLALREHMPILTVRQTDEAVLRFEYAPDKITVRAWSERYWDDTEAKSEAVTVTGRGGELFIFLKDGSYIYEVVATWTRSSKQYGTVRYSFCAQTP